MASVFYTFADVPVILANVWTFLSQAYFIGKPHSNYTIEDVPDQTGRTVIITGGNSGVGKETAKVLLQRNAKVYLACRNKTSAEETIKELEELTGRQANFLHLDLANLATVKAAAEYFLSQEKTLHILYNNAGVMLCPMDLEVNGYDAQIHTNVIGHFLFTQLLLPALLSTAQADKTIKPRIITLSSSAHYFAGVNPLDFNTFKCSAARRKRTTQQMYIQSKFANLVYSNELARRYGNQGLVCIAVNPGNIKTSLDRHIDTIFDRLSIKALQIYPVELGAISQLWAGTSPEAAKLNGKFVIPWANIGTPRKETLDVSLGGDLWNWLDEQVKEFIN